MDKILKDKKNLLIIGGIAVVAIIVIVLIFVVFNNNEKEMSPETLEDKLEKVGVEFYENYYYSNLEEATRKEKLALFTDNGIKIDITNLELLVTIDQDVKDQLEKDNCDLDETKIIVYPKEPYGQKDYKLELELSCEK